VHETTDELFETPRFSIVSAVYNVSLYLNDYFASLERQSVGVTCLDIVLVNDGSTDESGALCDAFAAKWPTAVRVVHQENGGAASARNAGLELVNGDWVTFCDPDDVLDENFFDNVGRFVAENDGVDIVATSLVFFYEKDGRVADAHPLRHKFANGSRVIDLELEPDHFQLHVNSALFRVDVIENNHFRMDVAVGPTFEDGHFISRFLLSLDRPLLGVVADARYLYRKRSDASSALDTSWSNPDRFALVPRFGYLALLKQAHREQGTVPTWLETIVVYDLGWYFKESTVKHADSTYAAFHESVAEIRALISPDAIRRFSLHHLSDEVRFALLYGYSLTAHEPIVRLLSADNPRRLAQFRYRFTGESPH
jgi:glycosyltransferase involved in cell wall biosynthesis